MKIFKIGFVKLYISINNEGAHCFFKGKRAAIYRLFLTLYVDFYGISGELNICNL